MDDDYNVISNGIQDDEDELHYPDDGTNGLAVVGGGPDPDINENRLNEVMSALEENAMGRRKRRIEDVEYVYDEHGNRSHPVDWHMRMPIYGDEVEEKQRKTAAKRRALEELENKINRAIEEDEQQQKNLGNGDDENGFGQGNSVSELCDLEMMRRFGRRREIMSQPPSDGSRWVGISDSGLGERFYVRMFRQEKENEHESLIDSVTKQITRSNLGYRTFQNIQKEAEEIRLRKLELADKDRKEELDEMLETSTSSQSQSQNDTHIESSLWVNKYEAKNFAELLSDDTVNRNILTWLKLWDECVFKKNVDNLLASLNDKDREILCMDSGKIRRPNFKMILIAGPAGLGKTTLARIVARQAGYSTIDVNASDARTVADLNRVLEGAVKTARTLDKDQRPACLILDEIDGSPIDTIRHLIRCLQAPGKKAVRRPIIGICNNLFTPALRELRSVAWCVQLSATKQDSLTRRLQQICEAEKLRCDATTLRRLCEMCANDMRHSINTLQWVAVAVRKTKSHQIGMRLVQEVMAKEKSGAASIFEHWSAILEVSKHVDGKGGVKSVRDRVFAIQKIAADHGGEDRFVSGLHANYLVSLPIGQIRKASKTFLFYDDIQKIIHSLQNWTVQRYSFAFFVSLHLTVATHARINIVYPQTEQNYQQKLKESDETLSCVRSNGHVSKGAPKHDLLMDVLPYLVNIVQPPIKPMNEQLYSQRDLSLLNSAVSAMCDYGLTYSATMVKDQINWLFSPSIDILTMFPISEIQRRHALANAVRQIIAHKITLLRVNLAGENEEKSVNTVTTNTAKIKQIVDAEARKEENAKKKRLSAGAMKRIRYQKLSDVAFVHQDGDSSAVKKKVTMHQMNSILFGQS